MNQNLDFWGGQGPRQGVNGSGIGGVYYDWFSNSYRSTLDGGYLSNSYALGVIEAYGTKLPDNTNLSTISFGHKSGVSGIWYQTTVSVGEQSRIGDVGSADFKATFPMEVIKRFTALSPSGQEGGAGEKLYGANATVVGTGLSVDVISNLARYAGEAGESVRTLAETASRRLIVVSAGITVADAVVKGQWQPHHTADVAISAAFLGASFIPGVNLIVWGAAGALFVTDLAVHHYTGKSVTENLFDSTTTDKTKNP